MTYLVIDPGPEAAAHIAAAAAMLEHHPTKLLLRTFDIRVQRWLLVKFCIMVLGKRAGCVESRQTTARGASGGVRMFELTTKVLYKAFEITQSIHDHRNTRVGILWCWDTQGCSLVGKAFEQARPFWRAIGGREHTCNTRAAAIAAWRKLITAYLAMATYDAATQFGR